MIKTLRRKFIFVNMLLVFLVLAIVFASLLFTTYSRLEQESYSVLSHALNIKDQPGGKTEIGLGPGSGQMSGNISYVVVTIDGERNVLRLTDNNASIEATAFADIIDIVCDRGEASGVIKKYNVRYIYRVTEEGIKIAIADRTGEKAIMDNLIGLSLAVGIGGLAAFFLISLFLSNIAVKPVETAWNRQRQFVADASHELKTPLTVILADTDIVLTHEEDSVKKQKKWLINTRDEALRMKELVDSMLYLAKSDAGREKMITGSVNVSDVLESAALSFEAVAFEKNIELKADVGKNLCINASPSHIKQMVRILLDNACKYCNVGGTVGLTARRDGGKTVIKVSNTGSFIPPEERERIFERFYRSDFARTREAGGYGLGLAIAKSIAEAHKGKITAASDNDGTVFTVTLPG